MLTILTNIPTPYRTTFFDALYECAQSRELGFRVLYCAETEPRRYWAYNPAEILHPHTILPGIHPCNRGVVYHVNLSVVRELRRLQPSILLIAGAWNTPTMLLAGTRLLVPRTRLIFWSEGHSRAVLHRRGLIAAVRRRCYQRYDAFAVPNSRSADWALSQVAMKRPIILLPNSVDTAYFARKNAEERAVARRKLGLPASVRLLVQVAALDPRKGPVELVQAFLGLPLRERSGAILALVGTGPLEPHLQELTAKSNGAIRLAGNVEQAEVRNWLMAADVFVLNTHRDPNPLAPIEAACAGLPILMSVLAGNVKESITEPAAGWIIADPRDPTSGLREVLAAPLELLEKLGARAARHALESFSARRVASSLLDQLQNTPKQFDAVVPAFQTSGLHTRQRVRYED